MRRWLISYTLASPGLEHMDFFDALREARAERILSTHWVLQSASSAGELHAQLASLLKPDDELLVAALGTEISWGTSESRITQPSGTP